MQVVSALNLGFFLLAGAAVVTVDVQTMGMVCRVLRPPSGVCVQFYASKRCSFMLVCW